MFYKTRRQHKENNEEPNYWISFSDFAFSFLISFILLTSLMLAEQYKQKEEADKYADEIKNSFSEIQENYAVRNYIAKELKKEFANNKKVEVDENTGRITLLNKAILFKEGDDILLSDPKFIEDFFEDYIRVLKNTKSPDKTITYYDNYIEGIIIEGHVHAESTDNQRWMELSQDRARKVYNIIYPQIKNDTKLKEKVQTVGRGSLIKYIYAKDNNDNRRVEFHFILNEEKIAEELADKIKNELIETGNTK